MKKLIAFILIIINNIVIVSAGTYVKTDVAVKTENQPSIDGTINDQEWSKAIWRNSFVACTGDARARQQTRFAVLFDAKNIYIAVKCDESHREKMKPYSNNDIDIWRHDSLEFFLQRVSGSKKYQQFLVSAGSGRYAMKFSKGINRSKKEIPHKEWQATAKMTSYGYAVEIKIPFALFDNKIPVNGTEWRFNIHRNAITLDSDRYSSWSPISKFHYPADFAYLIFAFSDPQLLQQRLMLKRKFNTVTSQIENMRNKYHTIDPLFASKLDVKLKNVNWSKFKKQGENIMNMDKSKLKKYAEQLSIFSLNFEKLKQFRSGYLLKSFFSE
jgi:Carbohydrate family 9 binding domain-like